MATYGPVNLPSFWSNDADFRAWGSGINAALAAVGLVQTADTGQINWATVLKPTLTNTVAGYEIWRFNDALQATRPVFIKIEYGTGTSVDRPSTWITVGTTTNGAGTVAGQTRVRTQAAAGSSDTGAGAQRALYASGSSSRLHLMFNLSTASTGFTIGLFIERTKDATGAETNDGVIVVQVSASPVYSVLPLTPGVTIPAPISYGPWVAPNNGNLSIVGLDIALCPLIAFIGKALFGFPCIYNNADIGALGTFVASLFGVNHTFMPMSSAAMGAGWNLPSSSIANGIAMLWE